MSEQKIYITPSGARTLRDELSFLWRTERPNITQVVSDAAALGDRSENADYIYGKKRLREIDSRIRFLTKRLENLEIVDRKPDDQSKVYFGAWLKLENDDGEVSTVRIVGADEFDTRKGWISMNSPVALGLLGKKRGDDILVQLPNGDREIHILEVSYEPFEETM
jgi:transcription elongation factor GreB